MQPFPPPPLQYIYYYAHTVIMALPKRRMRPAKRPDPESAEDEPEEEEEKCDASVDANQLTESEQLLLDGDPDAIVPMASADALRAMVLAVGPWLRALPAIRSADYRKGLVFGDYMLKIIGNAWSLVKAALKAMEKDEDVDPMAMMTALLHGTDDDLAHCLKNKLDTKYNGDEMDEDRLYNSSTDWYPTRADYALFELSGLMNDKVMIGLCAAVDPNDKRRSTAVRGIVLAKKSLLEDTEEQRKLGLYTNLVTGWWTRAECEPFPAESLVDLATSLANTNRVLRQVHSAVRGMQTLLAPGQRVMPVVGDGGPAVERYKGAVRMVRARALLHPCYSCEPVDCALSRRSCCARALLFNPQSHPC
jgi:hypothetical protein